MFTYLSALHSIHPICTKSPTFHPTHTYILEKTATRQGVVDVKFTKVFFDGEVEAGAGL